RAVGPTAHAEKARAAPARRAAGKTRGAAGSLRRLSPPRIVRMRWGGRSCRSTASAAAASGGETMAPSAIAAGHGIAGTSRRATRATAAVVTMTLTTARLVTAIQLSLRSRGDASEAAASSTGATNRARARSGSIENLGVPGTNARTAPTSARNAGYGAPILLARAARSAARRRTPRSPSNWLIREDSASSAAKARRRGSEELHQRVGRLPRVLLENPVARVLQHHDRRVASDQPGLLPERGAGGLIASDREDRHRQLRLREHGEVGGRFLEGNEVGPACPHPSGPRIRRRVGLPVRLGHRAGPVRREVVPEMLEVSSLAPRDQFLRRRAVEAEVPDPRVVVDRLPAGDAGQESVHEDELLGLPGVLRGVGVRD